MWEPDTLNVPLTQGLPSDRWTWGLVLVTEGRWWKHEADRDSGTVSILCGAEIDLTFKLPTLFDLSAIKLYFCLTRSVTRSHWTEQPKPAAAGWGWLWNHWLVNKKWEEEEDRDSFKTDKCVLTGLGSAGLDGLGVDTQTHFRTGGQGEIVQSVWL